MQWTGISVRAEDIESEDAVTNLLLAAGAAGVALGDADGFRVVTAYLPTDDRVGSRLQQIQLALQMLPDLGIDGASSAPEITIVDELDWANAWKAYFKPIRIGRHILVTPPWESPGIMPGDIVINIDPGMAFGTGTHGTTQLCLALLEEYIRPGDRVADIGTGSGILAIAASKLGASTVTATDIDPLAARIAGENCQINDVVVLTGIEFPGPGPYDLVVSNIIAETLISMSEQFAEIVHPDGILIVSGIIEGRENDVRLYVELSGFHSLETRNRGEWVALAFRRIDR